MIPDTTSRLCTRRIGPRSGLCWPDFPLWFSGFSVSGHSSGHPGPNRRAGQSVSDRTLEDNRQFHGNAFTQMRRAA